jgi:hypothetical protein
LALSTNLVSSRRLSVTSVTKHGIAAQPGSGPAGVADPEFVVMGLEGAGRGLDALLEHDQVLGVNFAENGGDVFAHVLGCDFEDMPRRLAGEGHAHGAVGPQDKLVDHTGNLMVNPIEAGRQILGLGCTQLLRRDVAGDLGGADDLAGGITDRRDAYRDVDQGAVLALAHGFEMLDRLPGAEVGDDPGLLFQTVRGKELRDLLPHHFGCGVAENSLRAPVPAGDPAIQRFADDGVIGGAHDGGKQGHVWPGGANTGAVG